MEHHPEREAETLKEEMTNVIEEARMVLPGIQALFGFQTIAVFNQRFDDLDAWAHGAHLLALGLSVVAVALIMAPASYHRIAERGQVSRHLVDLASALIGLTMLPLAASIGLDVFVVFALACGDTPWAAVLGGAAFIGLCGLWFVFPWLARRSRAASRRP